MQWYREFRTKLNVTAWTSNIAIKRSILKAWANGGKKKGGGCILSIKLTRESGTQQHGVQKPQVRKMLAKMFAILNWICLFTFITQDGVSAHWNCRKTCSQVSHYQAAEGENSKLETLSRPDGFSLLEFSGLQPNPKLCIKASKACKFVTRLCIEASKWDHLYESFRKLVTHKITFCNEVKNFKMCKIANVT